MRAALENAETLLYGVRGSRIPPRPLFTFFLALAPPGHGFIPKSAEVYRARARPNSRLSQHGKSDMTNITKAGNFMLGDRTINRMGYGAMQLAGPGVFGPPKDRDQALAVLREAIASGVNQHRHQRLPMVTARHQPADPRGAASLSKRLPWDRDQGWREARCGCVVELLRLALPKLTSAVHDNLRNLGVDALDVVNLRVMGDVHAPSEASIAEQLTCVMLSFFNAQRSLSGIWGWRNAT